MSEIVQDIKTAFSKIWAVLSLDDALITAEGKAFLSDEEKMKEFYKKLDEEKKKVESENKEKVEQPIPQAS